MLQLIWESQTSQNHCGLVLGGSSFGFLVRLVWVGLAVDRAPPHRRPSTIRNVSGTAVRNGDVNRDHPRARRPSDHRPSQTSLGPHEKNRDRPFSDFVQKNYALCGNCLNLEFGSIQSLAD
jgi:hypothetical protein